MKKVILKKSQIYEGNLILVNACYPIRALSEEGLVPVNILSPDILMQRDGANALQYIFNIIRSVNKIAVVSGYRTTGEQMDIYRNSLRDNGHVFTEKYVALPNHSEHQTGLAIDLGLQKERIDFIRPEFPYYGICNEFRKIAPFYGFIERYQREKESITGIAHEPWHFRYVGYPHSEIMVKEQLSFEEYIEYLREFTFDGKHLRFLSKGNDVEIFYIPYNDLKNTEVLIPEHAVYQLSGNNVDGFIMTVWRCGHE